MVGNDRASAPAKVHATVAAGPLAPSVARACVTSWLEGRVDKRVLDDALLLISEMVSNGVRHADAVPGAPLHIRAELNADALRLEVADTGQDGAVAVRAPDPRQSSGFGMRLVDRLAARWGVTHRDGTAVWCELR